MKKPYFTYILAMLIFGTNGIISSHISLSSAEIVWSRTILGGIFLILVFLLTHGRVQWGEWKRQWKMLLASGVSMGLSWIFLFEAYRLASVSTATLTYYCGPVIVMALSPLLFREAITWPKCVGIGAVVLGMVCVNGTDFLTEGLSAGLICGLLSAICYAVMIISNKKLVGLSGLEITLAQLLIACVVVGPYAIATHRGTFSLNAESLIFMLILGAVNTGLACFLYFSSIHALPAQSVAIFSYMDPLSALLFSALFLGERLSAMQLVGALFILGGAAFGQLMHSPDKKLPQPQNLRGKEL